jgi:hypothetical protein
LETEEEKAHARSSLARYSQKCKWYLDTGYAFSGEPGHDLPITDPMFYEKQVVLTDSLEED